MMKNCKCGSEVRAQDYFCPQCGQEVNLTVREPGEIDQMAIGVREKTSSLPPSELRTLLVGAALSLDWARGGKRSPLEFAHDIEKLLVEISQAASNYSGISLPPVVPDFFKLWKKLLEEKPKDEPN